MFLSVRLMGKLEKLPNCYPCRNATLKPQQNTPNQQNIRLSAVMLESRTSGHLCSTRIAPCCPSSSPFTTRCTRFASPRLAIYSASQVATSPIHHPPSPGHQAIPARIGSLTIVESTQHLLNQDRSPFLAQATPRAASWHQHHHPSAEGCSHPSKQAS